MPTPNEWHPPCLIITTFVTGNDMDVSREMRQVLPENLETSSEIKKEFGEPKIEKIEEIVEVMMQSYDRAQESLSLIDRKTELDGQMDSLKAELKKLDEEIDLAEGRCGELEERIRDLKEQGAAPDVLNEYESELEEKKKESDEKTDELIDVRYRIEQLEEKSGSATDRRERRKIRKAINWALVGVPDNWRTDDGLIPREEAMARATEYAKNKVERQERLAESLCDAEQELEELDMRIAELKDGVDDMDSSTFMSTYSGLKRRSAEIKEKIAAGIRVIGDFGPTARFVPKSEIRDLQSFNENLAMYWPPTSEEVARILRVAAEMHEERVNKGEIGQDEPVTITEIGGANGMLSKLIQEAAEANGIKVRIELVDPYRQIIAQAAEEYSDAPIDFLAQDSHSFIRELHADDPEIFGLLEQQKEMMELPGMYRTAVDFAREHLSEDGYTAEALEKIIGIFRKDFGIELDAELVEAVRKDPSEDNLDALYEAIDDPSVKYDIFMPVHKRVQETHKEVDRILGSRPADRDLVINSWMPPCTDFTADIRAVNGAAIVYAKESGGATGLEMFDLDWNPSMNSEDGSYREGRNYERVSEWKGPSINETRVGRKGATGFGNTIIIQKRRDFGPLPDLDDPEALGIKAVEPYPWEKDLQELDLMPTRTRTS